ncbi:GIY-YIG nuclease family protein [Azohydromonas sediminis]|uniref:GIY-YIG nuclease family protein n=1 Tax=Azohydromonas sediminis TaxID=2259674 RepID=UPI000E65CE3E|nr:GIY-YIG nuclease family protein [Azohydromonas sediminis]
MEDASYYVYALKDPRTSPALPFYVGKGTGTRSHDHLTKPDRTRKGARIREIEASGRQVLVTRLVDHLTEQQALRLEAELIAAFGTVDSGGLLTNTVIPAGLSRKARRSVVVPSGVKEKAQLGLSLIKEAVLELAKANPEGISNADAASLLGLRSDYGGGSKDYLSYSVLGLLMCEGKLQRTPTGKKHVARVT